MAEDKALLEKREELKRQLGAGECKTLVDVYLDGIGRLIQRLTRNPEPLSFWYSAVVSAVVTLLISLLASLLLDESYSFREMILPEISGVAIALVFVIMSKIYIGITFTNLRSNLLDTIESVANLVDLQHWLTSICNVKRSLIFSLAYGISVGFYVPILWTTTRGGFFGFGPTILLVITSLQAGMFGYSGLLFLALPARLSRYQYHLHAADPSSSEVVDHLSDMLGNLVYVGAILAAIVTLFVASIGLLTTAISILLLLLAWLPLSTLFVLNQHALARIITRAKWKTLNEIQAQIERVRVREDVPSEETLAHLSKLMDYHDRIKATPNSALDLRAGLNFLNSLLLPLIAFILTNLDKVLELFP